MNPTQAQHSIKRGLQLFYHKINPSFILCVCAEVSGRASRGKPKPIGSNFSAQFVGVSKENTDLHQGGTQRQTPVCWCVFVCAYLSLSRRTISNQDTNGPRGECTVNDPHSAFIEATQSSGTVTLLPAKRKICC